MKERKGDQLFFWLAVALLVLGIFAFLSASLSVYAQDPSRFTRILINHLGFGVGGGLVLFGILVQVSPEKIRTWALWILGGALVLTLLVFVPGIGDARNGAARWLDLGPFSLQPGEFLKLASILAYASWLSHVKKRVSEFKYGLLPLGVLLVVVGGILLMQPDTDSFMIIAISLLTLYFVAGGSWKHIAGIGLVGIAVAVGLVLTRPYLLDRFQTFIDPASDPLGASYQIQQSFIALGSGGIAGRGFGQSVQKFRYLPEPMSDSIFAVIGEEGGFLTTFTIVVLYMLFLARGFWIARQTKDLFGSLVVTGILVMLVAQSFLNIASTVGLFPLSGLPLIFISQGGTAMLTSLASLGIIMGISRWGGKKRSV